MLNFKKGTILLTIFLFAAGLSYTQELTFPPLKGFKLKSEYPHYTADNLWDFIDGAADSYLSYGFIDAQVVEYKKGKETIKAEIYHLKSNIMAFGIYSSERSATFRFLNIGAQGYLTDGSLNFFKGNYYIKLRTFSKKSTTIQSEQNLAVEIANMLGGSDKMPDILGLMPNEGKKANSEVFINENVLGHEFLSNALKADYQAGPDNFSIFIIRNESPDSSRRIVETYLAATGIEKEESAEGKFILTDGYNGKIFLSWKGNLVVIIWGLEKDQAEIADRYTSEILRMNSLLGI
jgi:hypothetical protein